VAKKGKDMKVVDATGTDESTFTIEETPVISHEDAQDAADIVAAVQDHYKISDEHMDALYSAMMTVFVRGEYCKQAGFKPNGKDDN
jgi:hypothetical protein